jgi:hypothetical protein
LARLLFNCLCGYRNLHQHQCHHWIRFPVRSPNLSSFLYPNIRHNVVFSSNIHRICSTQKSFTTKILQPLCKCKTIPVTALEAHGDVRRRDLTYFLDSRLIDGGEVRFTSFQASCNPQEGSLYPFLLEAEYTPGPSAAGRIMSVDNPVSSSGIQPTT